MKVLQSVEGLKQKSSTQRMAGRHTELELERSTISERDPNLSNLDWNWLIYSTVFIFFFTSYIYYLLYFLIISLLTPPPSTKSSSSLSDIHEEVSLQ